MWDLSSLNRVRTCAVQYKHGFLITEPLRKSLFSLFLILLIWTLYLFFLVSLARGFSILFILSKNQLAALLIFFLFVEISILLFSSLVCIISFLMPTQTGFAF